MAHGQQSCEPHHEVQANREDSPDGEHSAQGDSEPDALPYGKHHGPGDDHQVRPQLYVSLGESQDRPRLAGQSRNTGN